MGSGVRGWRDVAADGEECPYAQPHETARVEQPAAVPAGELRAARVSEPDADDTDDADEGAGG